MSSSQPSLAGRDRARARCKTVAGGSSRQSTKQVHFRMSAPGAPRVGIGFSSHRTAERSMLLVSMVQFGHLSDVLSTREVLERSRRALEKHGWASGDMGSRPPLQGWLCLKAFCRTLANLSFLFCKSKLWGTRTSWTPR